MLCENEAEKLLTEENYCRNCGTTLTGEYCPVCGQRDIDLERPLGTLLGEVLRETFEFDGRAFRTVSTLFARPGFLTNEFLAGHRRRYTPPFRLYLVISILFFVVAAWTAGTGMLLEEGQTRATDAALQARFLSDTFPKLMFVLLPAFAFLLKAAFLHRFYFDHLIHALHLHCAVYVALAFLLPLEQAANEHWLPLIMQVALLLAIVIYFFVSIRTVYAASLVAAVGKSIAILFGYLILISLVMKFVGIFRPV